MSDDDFISKTRRKTAMLDLQALGEELITLSEDRLAKLDLPELLQQAIVDARRITRHGALKRQRQYIGRLMRDVDPGPIREVLDGWRHQSGASVVAQHLAERWRERLIADDQAFTNFASDFPRADLSRLRQLARIARDETGGDRPPRAFRELYRVVYGVVTEVHPEPKNDAATNDGPP